ncbi:hypothetical protein Tco_1324216, partial [Tanacetum coccineum]
WCKELHWAENENDDAWESRNYSVVLEFLHRLAVKLYDNIVVWLVLEQYLAASEWSLEQSAIVAKLKDFVYLLDNYQHDWLFLQCAAVVHHGGAGTTAAGLKAAGVGPPPILVEEFSLKKLVSAIELMLKPAVKVSATELAKAMANENGVKGAVDAFHKHFACRKAKPDVTPRQGGNARRKQEWISSQHTVSL